MIKDRYLPFLQNVLTPRRLDHSLGVMQVMGELAQVYNLDEVQALSVGILHDAAKDLPPHQQKQLLEEGAIPIRHDCENDYVHYLHAPVGAYFVKKELGITDELVLDAIATHCFFGDSRHFNHPLGWCVRFADLIEPTRNWGGEKIILEGASRLRDLVYAGQLDAGAHLLTSTLITWFTSKGIAVHPHMQRIQAAYTK